jgi:hypothetical protein
MVRSQIGIPDKRIQQSVNVRLRFSFQPNVISHGVESPYSGIRKYKKSVSWTF